MNKKEIQATITIARTYDNADIQNSKYVQKIIIIKQVFTDEPSLFQVKAMQVIFLIYPLKRFKKDLNLSYYEKNKNKILTTALYTEHY